MNAVAACNAQALPTPADHEQVYADHRRLVRELDVLLNGHRAAPQASLCDIVAQLALVRWDLSMPILDRLERLENHRCGY